MKKPTQPIKPHKPAEPSKHLAPEKRSYSISTYSTTLADVINATAHIDPAKVKFDSISGYYDDYDHQFKWEEEPKLNPKYDKQMVKYEAEMEKYDKEITIYNSDLKEYNSINKQYLKWYHENELKKLG